MNPTIKFLAELQRPRSRSWTLPYGSAEPLVPWITPCNPPKLLALFKKHGRKVVLKTGENIYDSKTGLDHMTLVTRGLAGRCFGKTTNQEKEGYALTIPGRIAGGNHSFYSGRPGNGSYFAICPVTALVLSNARIKMAMDEDSEFRHEMEVQLECLIQSDRIGLAANMCLPVKDRILLFYLSWAFSYGTLSEADGFNWVNYKITLSIPEIARIVTASPVQVQRELTAWKKANSFFRSEDKIMIRGDLIDKVWTWLCANEETPSFFKRDKDWKVYLT